MTRRPGRSDPCVKEWGAPKVARSRESAIIAAIDLTLDKGRYYSPYLCSVCGWWHAGTGRKQRVTFGADYRVEWDIELGRRAVGCLTGENQGAGWERLRVLRKRCRRVLLGRDAFAGHERRESLNGLPQSRRVAWVRPDRYEVPS